MEGDHANQRSWVPNAFCNSSTHLQRGRKAQLQGVGSTPLTALRQSTLSQAMICDWWPTGVCRKNQDPGRASCPSSCAWHHRLVLQAQLPSITPRWGEDGRDFGVISNARNPNPSPRSLLFPVLTRTTCDSADVVFARIHSPFATSR